VPALSQNPSAHAGLIPIVAIAGGCAVKIARITAQSRSRLSDPDTSARLAALGDEVGALRQELAEAQERIDFTERLLTRQRTERLEPPQ
jgi:hypothetical protein